MLDMRRPHPAKPWGTRLAIRAIFTSASALMAWYVVRSTALPKVQKEMGRDAVNLPAALTWLSKMDAELWLVPTAGIALGVLALMLRSLRLPLALLATLATVLAVMVIVGRLVSALAPMYAMPQ